jgi:hypothetical protein
MLNFPQVNDTAEPAVQKMSLRDYAHFSVFCLENNPHITWENCLDRDAGDRAFKEPFRLHPK